MNRSHSSHHSVPLPQNTWSKPQLDFLTFWKIDCGFDTCALDDSPLFFREESDIPPVPHHPNESFKFPKRSFEDHRVVLPA